MLTPAEEQALQAAQLAAPAGNAPPPSSIAAVESANPAGADGLPGAVPVGGMPIALAPGESIQKTDQPFHVDTTKAKTLAPQAQEAQQNLEAAQGAIAKAEQMTIPVDAAEPFVPKEEYAKLKESTPTLNYGQWQDIKGRYQAKVSEENQAQLLAERQQQQADLKRRIDESTAKADKAWEDVARNAKERDLAAKPGWGTKILQAIASAFSTYAHIRMGHSGPSPVQQALEEQTRREAAERKAQMEADIDAAKRAGARSDSIMKQYEAAERDAAARAIIREKWAAQQVEKMGAMFPQHQRAAEMEAAQRRADALQKTRDLFTNALTGEKEQQKTGLKSEEITKTGSTTGGEVQREKAGEIAVTNMQIRGLEERNRIIKNNPAAWRAYQKAIKETDEAEKLEGTALGNVMTTGQGLGYLSMAADQRLDKIADPKVKADAKRINQLDPIVHAGQGRILDPVGVLNEGSLRAARKSLNIYTSTPESAIELGNQFLEQFKERQQLLTAGPKMQTALATAQGQAKPPARGLKAMPPEVRQRLQEALKVKKGDKDYAEAQSFILKAAKMYGEGRP